VVISLIAEFLDYAIEYLSSNHMGEFNLWFEWRRGVIKRLFLICMLLFASGSYMYVWCELFTPRLYSGRLRARFGMLPTNSELLLLRSEFDG